ncbi:membrane protein [Streptomyces spiroverticillatus]|uniref:Membrane protein n=1 Tax=Streptomyces finlayi TaxID=67296 RepID=A0A918X304_9ACTN|nr:hypothetical protein [Streptomyces finlayi]GGZ94869.1 membrane protein [Streptomyces spiroverticillatus]GHD07209.1 membrane protein [Streptomyces finlayi]
MSKPVATLVPGPDAAAPRTARIPAPARAAGAVRAAVAAGPGPRGTRVLRAVALLTAPALLLLMGFQRRWMSDDGLIVVRTVRQILAGNGPVFNAGERVESVTSPAWAWLLAALSWVSGLAPEDAALLAGLLLAPLGLLLGCLGTVRLVGLGTGTDDGPARGVPVRVLPAGCLVVAVLPPFWDFTTSGLEISLVMAWLGWCWWALTALVAGLPERATGVRLGLPAALLGLGPLVRPELALVSGCLLLVLRSLADVPWRRAWRPGLCALALPVTYEIFRMAYYGMLVPNSAVAKEGLASEVLRGIGYVVDLERSYWLGLVGVLLVVAFAVGVVHHEGRAGRTTQVAGQVRGVRARARQTLRRTAFGAGLLSAGYVVVVGGDFMHARLLLPAVFLLVLPVTVVPLPARASRARVAMLVTLALVGVWAVLSALVWRPSYGGGYGPGGVTDERLWWSAATATERPLDGEPFVVALDKASPTLREALDLRAKGVGPARALLFRGDAAWLYGRTELLPKHGTDLVVSGQNAGSIGALVPLDGHAVDTLGLTSPLASHLEMGERGRPGHEKSLSGEWLMADYAVPGSYAENYQDSVRDAVAAGRRALACPGPAELLAAVREPLTAGRLWANLTGARARTALRIPQDPGEAERALCRRDLT